MFISRDNTNTTVEGTFLWVKQQQQVSACQGQMWPEPTSPVRGTQMMDPNTHDDWAQQRWRKEDYEEQLSVFLASMHVIPNTIVFFLIY